MKTEPQESSDARRIIIMALYAMEKSNWLSAVDYLVQAQLLLEHCHKEEQEP